MFVALSVERCFWMYVGHCCSISDRAVNSLPSFPGLPTILLWCTICKNRLGKAGSIYHMNDVNFYLGRQREVGSKVRPAVSIQTNTVVPNIHKAKMLPLIAHDDEMHMWNVLFQSGVPPSLCLCWGRHWDHSHDNAPRPSPSVFVYCRHIINWMMERPGNEAIIEWLWSSSATNHACRPQSQYQWKV